MVAMKSRRFIARKGGPPAYMKGNIGKMAGSRGPVAFFDIGHRPLTGLHAIEEVSGVGGKQIVRGPFPERLRPGDRFHIPMRLRAADGVPQELRDLIFGRHLGVRSDFAS